RLGTHCALHVFLLPYARPPSAPPAVPYTTLFRSVGPRGGADAIELHEVALDVGLDDRAPDTAGRERLERRRHTLARSSSPTSRADRKSTRLNSSHQIISYAVFCLKKKRNENMLNH